jgi:hypothetical protein
VVEDARIRNHLKNGTMNKKENAPSEDEEDVYFNS